LFAVAMLAASGDTRLQTLLASYRARQTDMARAMTQNLT
jgi:hypothetical protein